MVNGVLCRDFSKYDENDPDQAEGRREKRRMIQENTVARAKRKKDEYKRLNDLVKRAAGADPRLKKFAKEEQEEKERKAWERDRAAREAAEAKAKEEAEKKGSFICNCLFSQGDPCHIHLHRIRGDVTLLSSRRGQGCRG